MERFGAGELAYMLGVDVVLEASAAEWLLATGDTIVESLTQDRDLWEYPEGQEKALGQARLDVGQEEAPALAWLIVGQLGLWRRVDWESIAPMGTHWDGKAGLMLPPDPSDLAGLMLINAAEALIEPIFRALLSQVQDGGVGVE